MMRAKKFSFRLERYWITEVHRNHTMERNNFLRIEASTEELFFPQNGAYFDGTSRQQEKFITSIKSQATITAIPW